MFRWFLLNCIVLYKRFFIFDSMGVSGLPERQNSSPICNKFKTFSGIGVLVRLTNHFFIRGL